ncbi:hypothetical protein BDGGKGIB_01147 [Nodularia sphaerocarpa UHCC 0038]|nr:hypothetical protein BDGGKGIB_01147 [Nodularia sphaerocarpa UHCC 0038]
MNLGVGCRKHKPTPTILGFVGFPKASTQPTNILFFHSNKTALGCDLTPKSKAPSHLEERFEFAEKLLLSQIINR